VPAKSYTGATTAGTAIEAAPVTVMSIQWNAAATSVVTIFDNAAAASGTILFQKTFPAASIGSVNFGPGNGLKATNGLFAVVATATCQLTANVV